MLLNTAMPPARNKRKLLLGASMANRKEVKTGVEEDLSASRSKFFPAVFETTSRRDQVKRTTPRLLGRA